MKEKMRVSFSGGRSSALMLDILLKDYGQKYDMVFTFCNTGQEHEKSLEFTHKCDQHFGLNLVWLEAVIGPAGVGTRHNVVTYETANRTGKPFEDYIKKHGIPNPKYPQCTTRLKTEVMDNYTKEVLGWAKGEYWTAIGLRADELDRMNPDKDKLKIVYPLIKKLVFKADVKRFWREMPFNLEIPEHFGNCVWCWKKSFRKLLTLTQEAPEIFEFPARMEQLYSGIHKGKEEQETERVFFRGNRSTKNIFEMAQKPFVKFTDGLNLNDLELDFGGGCGDSCEMGTETGSREDACDV